MFLGKFSRTLDAKSRFSVPATFREQLNSGVYLTQGFDRNVQVLTTSAFQQIYRTVMSLNIANPLARLLLRLILGTAHESGVDDDGHITVPHDLKDFANLQEDVFLIGQGDYFEIWAPDLWDQQEAQVKDVETNSGRFSALTVTTR